ncbi:type 2 lantipeptide synthetase LanM family protein [Myxococcus sp. K15C18031901]|nr:type 2 lantipeptide synthetase LanM family protein [Myxococcus dinghuensis]
MTGIAGLATGERDVIVAATRDALEEVLSRKLGRMLLLELNAARVTGRLKGEDAEGRWAQFVALSSQRAFWDEQAANYPTMLPRVERIVRNRCDAAHRFAQRWVEDRPRLDSLWGGSVGALTEVSFGAGDSHLGGQTVVLVRCEGGRLVYKPRSVAVDAALRQFLLELSPHHEGGLSIRVPRVLERETHGWAEFIPHRYSDGEAELRGFYRGVGHWLAVMRLVSGSDLHAENVIAAGDAPVVVDCETLFTPKVKAFPSGLGEAMDRAIEQVNGSVLMTGMLPGRGMGLGWRGVDNSSVGMLPGQQPRYQMPGIVNEGTDRARVGLTPVEMRPSQNHPSQKPALDQYWPQVLEGFDALTATLRRLDAEGALANLLAPFKRCRIRVVLRATEVYAELARMLWHPVSLHKDGPARARANDLLTKMAGNVSSAPSAPDVIAGEVEELLEGDIPCFTALASEGRLEGPRGTRWLPPTDLVDAALKHWREGDFVLERNVIQSTLVSAYINDGWMPEELSLRPRRVREDSLDTRRRKLAADIMRRLVATAIHGGDGTVTWIAPILGQTGWAVQPLEPDLYGGSSGVAVLVGAYLREVARGRADGVEGAEALLKASLRTLDLGEERRAAMLEGLKGVRVRPPTAGGYIGLGSQIWARLLLADWALDGGEGLSRAEALAEGIPAAAEKDELDDVLSGKAGAIVPLLSLMRRTGNTRYLDMARALGDALCQRARRDGDTACWPNADQWPEGVGGYVHGVTGIGWVLTLLARATGEGRYAETARAAFAFEENLYDEQARGWRDLRGLEGAPTAAAWCHGAVGIGLAHLDLDPTLSQPHTRVMLRRAAGATYRQGLGWNHCACHGDTGAWELLERAIALGEGPEGVSREQLLASILTSIEDHGPSCGLARNAFVPGLLPGLGGVVYQLLRAHPEHALPSILVLGGGAAS